MIKYVKLYKWANRTDARRTVLKVLDYTAVIAVVLAYAGYLTYLFIDGGIEPAFRAVVFSALPFLLFTFFRKSLNAPRPYEVMNFEEMGFPIPSKKRGSSFPSRHVFSATLIATMMLLPSSELSPSSLRYYSRWCALCAEYTLCVTSRSAHSSEWSAA